VILAITCPYIGAGDGGSGTIIFIVIGLVWLIANLLKKASQASKSPPSGRPRPQTGVEGKTDAAPRASSLSEFLRTLKEMSQGQAAPHPPQQPGGGEPRAGTSVPQPPPPRRPTSLEKRMPRPALVREPSLKPVQRREMPPEPELVPGFGRLAEEVMEVKTARLTAAAPLASQAPESKAYAIRRTAPPRITQLLGAELSTSEVRKGIVMAEILGRPKALRRRGGPLGRR